MGKGDWEKVWSSSWFCAGVTKLRGSARSKLEFAISKCKLLYTGWINNKILLNGTGNYILYPVTNRNGKEYEKNVYMHMTESLCCTAEINTTL